MAYDTLLLDQTDAVLTVTVNRPEVLNAQSRILREELDSARPYPPGLPGRYQRGWDLNVANTLRWRDFPKPTIARVQGYCIMGTRRPRRQQDCGAGRGIHHVLRRFSPALAT